MNKILVAATLLVSTFGGGLLPLLLPNWGHSDLCIFRLLQP